MIQSSHPSCLKFTWRGLRLHRVLRLPLPFPPPPVPPPPMAPPPPAVPAPPERPPRAVLLFWRRLGLPWPSELRSNICMAFIFSRISLNRFSFLRVREKATSKALSFFCCPSEPKPTKEGKTTSFVKSETTAMLKHTYLLSCVVLCNLWLAFRVVPMLNTSQVLKVVSRMLMVLEVSSRGLPDEPLEEQL